MNVTEFERLPLLLRRKQVLEVTGWDPRTLVKEADAGAVVGVRSRGGRRMYYRKLEVARLVGLEGKV